MAGFCLGLSMPRPSPCWGLLSCKQTREKTPLGPERCAQPGDLSNPSSPQTWLNPKWEDGLDHLGSLGQAAGGPQAVGSVASFPEPLSWGSLRKTVTPSSAISLSRPGELAVPTGVAREPSPSCSRHRGGTHTLVGTCTQGQASQHSVMQMLKQSREIALQRGPRAASPHASPTCLLPWDSPSCHPPRRVPGPTSVGAA